MRADGPDTRTLGDVVAHTFGLRGQEYADAEWDSWKGEDGKWVVALSWRAGRSDNRAHWTFQPGAHGGTVTALDEHASDLVEGLPARPLRTGRPGDRHRPAGRGAAARAVAGEQCGRPRPTTTGAAADARADPSPSEPRPPARAPAAEPRRPAPTGQRQPTEAAGARPRPAEPRRRPSYRRRRARPPAPSGDTGHRGRAAGAAGARRRRRP